MSNLKVGSCPYTKREVFDIYKHFSLLQKRVQHNRRVFFNFVCEELCIFSLYFKTTNTWAHISRVFITQKKSF